MYDPTIGRTFQIDPHLENYYDWSPYSWSGNNPILMIDPTGMDWYDMSENDEADIQWRDGSDSKLKPGLRNFLLNLIGLGDHAESLGEEVLVIVGREEGEEVNEATFEFYSSENQDGPTATMTGTSIPADVNTMNTMEEGLYTETYLIEDYHDSGINAIAFEEGTVESTEGVPMSYLRVHRGNLYREERYDSNDIPWSRGCPAFGYGENIREDATTFGTNFTNNTNVYLGFPCH